MGKDTTISAPLADAAGDDSATDSDGGPDSSAATESQGADSSADAAGAADAVPGAGADTRRAATATPREADATVSVHIHTDAGWRECRLAPGEAMEITDGDSGQPLAYVDVDDPASARPSDTVAAADDTDAA